MDGCFNITKIDFRDYYGNLLWSEPMNLSRLFAVGDVITEKGKPYRVYRIAVADDTQHVNFSKESFKEKWVKMK